MKAFSDGQLLSSLEKHFERQLTLCGSLETIADSLPVQQDKQKCLCLSRSILNIVHEAHQFEEAYLFPALKAKSSQSEKMDQILDRLRYEHWEDESYSVEISEGLKEIGMGKAYNSEKLGYMLRGFFEGMRRHIAFETEILLPLFNNKSGANTIL